MTNRYGVKDLGSPSSVFTPINRQDTEGEERVMFPSTLNALC